MIADVLRVRWRFRRGLYNPERSGRRLMTADPALVASLVAAPAFIALERALAERERPRRRERADRSRARPPSLTLLLARTRRRFLLVVHDDAALAAWQRDLVAAGPASRPGSAGIVVFPALVADPYNDIPPHPEVERERVRALGRLARNDLDVLLVPAPALLAWLPSPAELSAGSRVVRRRRHACRRSGSSSIACARGTGASTPSRRPGRSRDAAASWTSTRRKPDEPVRIELFGDTVESLRSFDPDHQRSTGALARALIGPAAENPRPTPPSPASRPTSKAGLRGGPRG